MSEQEKEKEKERKRSEARGRVRERVRRWLCANMDSWSHLLEEEKLPWSLKEAQRAWEVERVAEATALSESEESKTCAVLRTRTRALFKVKATETIKGSG